MEPLCKTVLKWVVLFQTVKKNDHRGSSMPFKEQLLSAAAGGPPGHWSRWERKAAPCCAGLPAPK